MEEDKRQILEEILAKADALMVQCAELKKLVSSCLADGAVHEIATLAEDLPEAVGDEVEDLPEAGMETVEDDLPEAEPVEPGEDLPENEAVKVEEDLPEITPVQPEEDSVGTVLEEPRPSLPQSYAIDLDDDVSVIPIFEKARKHKESAVVDALASKESWRTDLPGSKVSDIRSAISLNDRILFINSLFGEDPAAFKETLTELNAMTSFEEGVTYVETIHPEWNMESDIVYRFMMAVRRRLQ